MRFKVVALLHSILFIWGLIMCIMNLLGHTQIPWYLAAMPIYGGLTIFLVWCILWALGLFSHTLAKKYKNIDQCVLCDSELESKKDESEV